MFLETCLSILNVAEKATRIYDWFTGVSAGEKKNSNVDSLAKNKSQIVRLSDRVLYAPSFHQVSSNEQARALNDNKKIYDLLDPMAQALETEVLASAVISTPEKLRSAFNKDPWEVLLDIRPVERTKKSSNPDLIPISFHDNNLQYIGWQTRGALPILFNCQFESNGNIWAPTPKVQKLNSRPKEVPISSQNSLSNELIDWFKIHGPIDDFHIYPNISYKLSQNAKSKFEAGYSDTILALIDTTLSKTALNFLAFGLKGIYYHNASYGDQPGFHFISYEEFSNRTLSTPWLHELKLDKGDSLLCCDCSISRKQLVLILKGVSNIVKKYF